MQAVVIEKPRSFRIQELPDLKPGQGEVALEVKVCCVCGTDIHFLDDGWPDILPKSTRPIEQKKGKL